MAGLLNRMTEWLIRVVVILSFVAHLGLFLFAGIRRRRSSGWRMLLLWLAYQTSDTFAKYALTNLSLGSTSREQQLVAFWAALLLVHLGGTDNITAYSLEDSKLWKRQLLNGVFQVGQTVYVLYKHIYVGGGGGTLLSASIIMFAVGIAKYLEKVWALKQGDLSSIQSSDKNRKKKKRSKNKKNKKKKQGQQQEEEVETGMFYSSADLRGDGQAWKLHDSDQALLDAHGLFDICKGAFADFEVEKNKLKRVSSDKIISPGLPMKIGKVVEMELSLMYDILYTKAAMIYKWHGYGIRVASPIATATATLLFWLYSKDGQRVADVIITYILLVTTFLMDVRCLLGSLRSTWTYAFLTKTPKAWLHHALVCSGRWHQLRRAALSVDTFLLGREPSRYRLWPGIIGQYNLFSECTYSTRAGLRSTIVKWLAPEDIWMEYRYSRARKISEDEKAYLFKRIWESLLSAYRGDEVSQRPLGIEFQELILIWHITTDIFLLHGRQYYTESSSCKLKLIEALSNYMVFLVAVRPDMLPGLKLHRLYTDALRALKVIWRDARVGSSKPRTSSRCKSREAELACVLRDMRRKEPLLQDSSIISDGTFCAQFLLPLVEPVSPITHRPTANKMSEKRLEFFLQPFLTSRNDQQLEVPDLILDSILVVWIRMLIYGSIRCSRYSHAKQLSRGGELTTIVWILQEHAGVLYPRRVNWIDFFGFGQ
ncbi:hypothetical protein ACP70R_046442 [Stipagrostis hirtigluma subsp. patula]